MQVKTVGIIGYGNFGQFLVVLTKRFLPDVTVQVYSRRHEIDDALFYDVATVAASDVVIVCGAIGEFEDQLAMVLECAREDTIVVDVATVKEFPTNLLRKQAEGRHFVSCHPMFGPESYRKHNEDVTGFRIVVTEHTLSSTAYTQLRHWLSTLGFVVIEMEAAEHDQLLAETLFLTHYLGQVVQHALIKRTAIDTVSFSYLMDAVESVQGDTRLFQDVFTYNHHCKAVLKTMHEAQLHVQEHILRVTK